MDVSGIEGVSPVAKAAYEFLEILARQHIRDRSHREPTNKRVNQQVTRWIEEDLIIPIVLVQIKRFLEIAKHWESSAFDQHLLRYFSQATLLSRKRGRPRRRRHRRLLPLLPMATAQGERKAELDYLKHLEEAYKSYVEGVLAGIEAQEDFEQHDEERARRTYGSLENWQKYKLGKHVKKINLPRGTLDDFMSDWDVDERYRSRLKMRFSRAFGRFNRPI